MDFITKHNTVFSGDQTQEINKLESFHSAHGHLTGALAMSVLKHSKMKDSY